MQDGNRSTRSNEEPDRTSTELAPARLDPPRFIVRFVLGLLALHFVLYVAFDANTHPLVSLLREWQTGLAASLLKALGRDVTAAGTVLSSPEGSLAVGKGCAGLPPIGAFVCAVLAFPASARAKLVGALSGVLVISTVNVVRLAALFVLSKATEEGFRLCHEHLFPIGIMFLALATWIVWAWRSLRS